MGKNDPKTLKTEFSDKGKDLTRKFAYAYECFKSIDGYQKPGNNLQKQNFFSKIKNKFPSDKEKERTKENINLFNFKNGDDSTQLFLKSDVLILAGVYEKSIKVAINEIDMILLYFVSFPSYTWQCGL